MLTDQEITSLIEVPKTIVARTPATGYRDDNRNIRCDVEMTASSDNGEAFAVFIRRHNRYIENFSIGLRYRTFDKQLGDVTLVRYNGLHGEVSRHPDGHFAKSHIHRITEEEVMQGLLQPQERRREITDRYGTFEEALWIFFGDIGTTNLERYFPELRQPRLFDGHS